MAIAAIAMISCSDDSTSGQGTGGQGSQTKTEPSTQVYIQGNKAAATRAAAAKVNKKAAHFFIRLDNRIAGAEDCKSDDYFPQDAFGNTVRLLKNKGYIDADYAYYSSNDDYDKYVYDSKGKATLDAIVEQPQLKDIIKANLNPKLKLKDIDIEDLYVIWYMVKKQKDGWHVDGVLTKKTNKDLSAIPGVGGLLIQAIGAYDNAVILGVAFFYGTLSIIGSILGDILMSVMDPRISYTSKAR